MAEMQKNESAALQDALHERTAEAVARGYARPRPGDFKAGWKAACEWYADNGECSMVKWFGDQQTRADDPDPYGQLND